MRTRLHLLYLSAGLALAAGFALLTAPIQAKPCDQEPLKVRVLQTENAHELVDHFAHFAKLKDETTCMAILERFDTLAMNALGKLLNVEEKARYIDLTGFVVSEMMATYHDSELSSETVRDRLDELIRHYPRKEEQ